MDDIKRGGKIGIVVNNAGENVEVLHTGYQKQVIELIQMLVDDRSNIECLLVAYRVKDGLSYVRFSPMSGGDMAYLSKQIDAEFLENFMFVSEED